MKDLHLHNDSTYLSLSNLSSNFLENAYGIKQLFPEIFLGVSILLLLTYGVIYTTSSKYYFPLMIQNIGYLSIIVLVIAFLLLMNNPVHIGFADSIHSNIILNNHLEDKSSLMTLGYLVNNPISLINQMLVLDDLTLFVKGVLLITSIASILISFDYIKKEKINFFEYFILVLLALLGMLLVTSSSDLMSMYLGIEFQSLCLYVLASFQRHSPFSAEAGLKYFILGAFSSGILLFGISILYGFTGITNFEDLAKIFISCVPHFPTDLAIENTSIIGERPQIDLAVIIGIIFIGIGLLFKIYAVPFHLWVPDVYQGSPTIVTAFFAITPSISIFALIIRFLISTFYDFLHYWQPVLLFSSIASMLVGSIFAYQQENFKRLLAYSAIGHVGYILLALLTASPEGIQALLIYIVIYICMTLNFFTLLLSLRKINISHFQNHEKELLFASNSDQINMSIDRDIDKKNKVDHHNITHTKQLLGFYQSNPILSITLTTILFSMTGIPPLAGFFSKLYVLITAIQSSFLIPVFIAIIASVISSVYYLRIIQIISFQKAKQWISLEQIDKKKATLLAITLFLILFFFIYPSPLLLLTHKIALTVTL